MNKSTLKTLVQGLGAAMLLMISHLAALVSPYQSLLYHSILPIRSVIWGALIDLAVLSLLAALLFHYLQKIHTGFLTLVWALLAARLTHATVGTLLSILGWNIPGVTSSTAVAAILIVALALWWLRPSAYQAAVRGLLVVLLLAGCTAVWLVPELVYRGLHAQRADVAGPVTNPMNNPALGSARSDAMGDRRVVWLLFDELSYDQTFEHRSPGLAMPFFDQFKSKSVVFTNLKPVGVSTETVIPSFFLGKPINKLRSNAQGQAMIQLRGSEQWQPFDAQATLFADARRMGWTTGIVGWFNPYCRILAGTLDSCFWRMGDGEFGGPRSTQSTFENAVSPIQNIVAWLQRKPLYIQKIHAEDLAALVPAATALIRDQSVRFVFIHLPIPHPPGIYNRATGTMRPSGTYLDNLALSDRVLGELMSTLNATPMASKTTVIICSDHSWRLSIWRPMSLWTKEEETASGGHFDPRPVLMIHSPGQQAEQDVTAPYDQLRIHDILKHMLQSHPPEFDKALLTGDAIASVPATP